MKVFYLLLFIFCTQLLLAQPILPTSILKSKQDEKQRLLKNIDLAFKLPITDTTYTRYQSAFWAMMYMEYKPKEALSKLKIALKNFSKYDNGFQNALLEVVYSQYPKELEKEIFSLIKDTSITAKQFAVCGEYLNQFNYKKYFPSLKRAIFTYQQKYCKTKKDSLYLKTVNLNLLNFQNKSLIDQNITFLKTLPSIEFLKSKNVIISLQNKNRNYNGIAIIKNSEGDYVKMNDTFFHTQQLARSITNLPYYISNGNTPQGIYRINGFASSTNTHIGPTENFQLCMPFECAVKDFFDAPIADTIWSEQIISKYISEYFAFSYTLQHASTAGILGRFEIIAHGTTVNNNYYNTKPYAGFTPTMGCLQTKEIWDYKTGKRIYSDQQRLIDAYKSIGAEKGYLIVLDIIDAPRAVNINDFKKLLK